MILLLTALTALMPEGFTADWFALLQTEYTVQCSADFLISGSDGELLRDGLPLAAIGSVPADLPWRNAVVRDPLQSGIWGSGKWNTMTGSGPFSDTLSHSRIGLIQNTEDRSRYVFELERPLPGGTSGSFFMRRNDSLSVHSASLSLPGSDLAFNGTSWEGYRYGWGTWTSWTPGGFTARAGFSRLNPGDRRPELLAGYSSSAAALDLEAGLAGVYADSVFEYRGAFGAGYSAGSISITARADMQNEEPGFWGGLTWTEGNWLFTAMHSSPSDGDAFQAVSIRHPVFNLVGRLSDNPSAAADISLTRGVLRGKAAGCWYFDLDSLAVNCHGLLGLNWFKGRLEAGPRFRGSMTEDGSWDGIVDGVLGFTLLPFSLSAAVEDITDDLNRSWSFGITWSFTDLPPQTSEGEDNDR